MASTQESNRKESFISVEGFNAHYRHWFDLGGLTTDHGLTAKYFTTNSSCEQLITGTPHRDGSCLDLLFNES